MLSKAPSTYGLRLVKLYADFTADVLQVLSFVGGFVSDGGQAYMRLTNLVVNIDQERHRRSSY